MSYKIIKSDYWREWLLGLISLCALVGVFNLSPIPQDPAYHRFADTRMILGVPNFWNVFSNVFFLLVGLFGLTRPFGRDIGFPHIAYKWFCAGVFFVGLGSAYYHINPTTQTLVWDRLPMTVAFMALFSMVIRDRISVKTGDVLLWPLLLAGVLSVAYWSWSELQGKGDLRAYALIQFLPMVLIPMILVMYRGKRMRTPWLWVTLVFYGLAKVMEYYDGVIYDSMNAVSGHSVKHVLGALAVSCVIFPYNKK